MIAAGDMLPSGVVRWKDAEGGVHAEDIVARCAGRTLVIFGLPGAFTPTCDGAHLPGFIRVADELRAAGVDEIICLSVNDVHVMKLWGEQSGAEDAGIAMLADGDGSLARAMGLAWSNPDVGFHDRSRRYAMLVVDGVVKIMHLDEMGVCAVSTGEAMLEDVKSAL